MNNKLINILIIIIIIDLIISGLYITKIVITSFENKYDVTDVNKDGKTSAKDLLIVQKKILEEHEERCD